MEIDLKNAEARILGWLNKLTFENCHRIGHLLTGKLLMDTVARITTKKLESLEDVTYLFTRQDYSHEFAVMMASELVEYAYDVIEEGAKEKLEERLGRFERKAANRAKYVPEPVFKFYELEDDDRTRWQFDRDLRSSGLMSLIVEELHGPQDEPVALGLLNQLPFSPKPRPEWLEEMDNLNANNVAVSGERLGWNMKSPAWPTLLQAFPKDIDLSAYGHGLNAPVLPEGYLPNVQVTFMTLRNEDGIDLDTDGSGIYHPDAPEMQAFIAKYGLVACQPRMMNPASGLFAKGTLFPSTRALNASGEPAIVFDWGQIKGRYKATAKKRRGENAVKTVDGCHIGMLFAWNRRARISSGFEMLECIQTNQRTIEIVRELTDDAMDLLEKRGMEGLVADVAKKDPIIRLMAQLVSLANQQGLDFHAWQVPRVRKAIEDKLGRRLYQISQGGGLKLPSYVCRLDATVPPGHCVVAGMNAGKTVVGFRFPMILSQGLVRLQTIKPKPHHLVNGEMTPHQVILNPKDLKLGMQGDDDGDVMGLTDNPLLVELFSHRLDERKYHIEPKGIPREVATNSPEGLKYLQTDHRGIVGRCTVWRSRLLAIGDYQAAVGMSVAVQENIDLQKRTPEWSDVRAAARLQNWKQDSEGEYHFSIRFDAEDLENGTGFPEKLVHKWVGQRLIQAGCCSEQTNDDGSPYMKAECPLWWRPRPGMGKRVDPANWAIPPEDPDVMQFENLVHIAARQTYKRWQTFAADFLTRREQVSMGALLPVVLASRGIQAIPTPMNWDQYWTLRNKSGLSAYNNKVQKAQDEKKKASGDDAWRAHERELLQAQTMFEAKLARAIESGTLTMNDLATIWVMEAEHEKGNLNNAFRVICWEGSPVLEILGLSETPKCRFLYRGEQNRLEAVVDYCLAKPDPFKALAALAAKAKTHGLEVKNSNGEPVHTHECPDCMEAMQTALVRAIRTRKTSRETEWLLQLHASLSNK